MSHKDWPVILMEFLGKMIIKCNQSHSVLLARHTGMWRKEKVPFVAASACRADDTLLYIIELYYWTPSVHSITSWYQAPTKECVICSANIVRCSSVILHRWGELHPTLEFAHFAFVSNYEGVVLSNPAAIFRKHRFDHSADVHHLIYHLGRTRVISFELQRIIRNSRKSCRFVERSFCWIIFRAATTSRAVAVGRPPFGGPPGPGLRHLAHATLVVRRERNDSILHIFRVFRAQVQSSVNMIPPNGLQNMA